MGIANYWFEPLFENNWTDPDRAAFTVLFVPESHWQGDLVESWEWKDAQTLVIKLHQGVHWFNKPPVNGREFVASDVVAHFDMLLGTGSGFTEPNPMFGMFSSAWQKATALDKYTFEIKFKQPTLAVNMWSIQERKGTYIETPEAVQNHLFTDWKDAIGTGAFMPTDYQANSYWMLSKNPDYWGFDERYPKNKLPYADAVKIISIPDTATVLAAVRTQKIDIMPKVEWQQADNMKKTNPELQYTSTPWMSGTVEMRADTVPFKDLRIRQALEMAIDRQAIAKSHYGGYTDGKPAGVISPVLTDYCTPYDDWPQDLKDGYSYNPTRVKALLKEAGYPNGFNTNIVASQANDLEPYQIIKAYFMDIGVDMEIRVMDDNTSREFINNNKHDQMCTNESSAAQMPPFILISMKQAGARGNPAMNNDPIYEGCVADFFKASDPKDVAKILKAADMRAISQYWTVNVCPKVNFNILSPSIGGYSGEGPDYLINQFYFTRFWKTQK
jgi:ABC-type transport system substrate-binding protein